LVILNIASGNQPRDLGRRDEASEGAVRRLGQSGVGRQALLCFLFFVVPLGLLIAVGPLAIGRSGWLGGFRNYFAADQLSYAAISANVAHAHRIFVEPFTVSGSSFYPLAYYVLIGVVARFTGVGVATSWNLMAIAFSVLLLAAGGWWSFVTNRRWWAPILALAPLAVGTITWIRNDTWGCKCGAPIPAAIWPVNAALYTSNGEVAGLVIGAIGLVVVLSDVWRRDGHLPGVRAAIIGFGLIGLTANVHTYAFFASLAAGLLTLWAILLREYGTRRARVATLLLLVASIPVGKALSATAGPIMALAAFALPLAPGAVLAVRRRLKAIGAAVLACAIAGAPQFIHIAVGLGGGDPFLSYRQRSGADLSVGPFEVMVAHLPIVLLVVVVGVAGWKARSDGRRGLPWLITAALVLGVVLMGWNNAWGFGQEPYRFVIDQLFFVLVIVPALGVVALRDHLALRSESSLHTLVVMGLTAATVLAVTVSLAGSALLWSDVRANGTIGWSSEMQSAARVTAHTAGDDLILIDPCVRPALWKLYTGGRVLFYNLGIAWPQHRLAIDTVNFELVRGRLDVDHLRQSGTKHVLTSTVCTSGIEQAAEKAGLTREVTTRWVTPGQSEQRFVLWRVPRQASPRTNSG
jgi:hypothetical protein